jgi:hypothetical protein
VRFWCLLAVLMMMFATHTAMAGSFDVANIQISIQSANAVKARDQAINRAQRLAFAQLVGQTEDGIKTIGDDQIARLVKDFSVRSERMAARSYQAVFTVRFDQYRAQNFIDTHGFILVDPTMQSPVAISENTEVVTTEATTTNAAPLLKTIAVLPVLDIGSRRVIWDEPNPWRDVWQRENHSTAQLKIALPLGDADDITDIPSADFLNDGAPVNIEKFLERYGAEILYVLVAKNQGAALDPSGGMALSLYKDDGKKLTFIRKNVIRPRLGYMFEDAVPAGMMMILEAQGIKAPSAVAPVTETHEITQTTTTETVTQAVTDQNENSLVVTVPYQSLSQWVDIQQRLRRVPGVKNIVPMRLSPSSAQVRFFIGGDTQSFLNNMVTQGFDLQTLPSGEVALIER